MEMLDQRHNNPYFWLDGHFEINELEAVIVSSQKNSAPDLNQIDYDIIRSFPYGIRSILLRIFNEMFDLGLFPHDWRTSLVVFVPKSNSEGLRTSCLLKTFEKMVYRRVQWMVESQFVLPEFQVEFRSFRSYINNLTILTNHIHLTFIASQGSSASDIFGYKRRFN